MKDRKPGWSWTTRLLHLLLAVSVTHQLFISLVMVVPQDNRPGDILFSLHENVGLATFAIILSYWSWLALRRSDRGARALFPWFSKSARTAVVNDVLAHLASLRRLRLPALEEQPLAAAVHGLGLLTATIMASTGAVAWSSLLPKATTAMIWEVHMTLGNVMWAYLIGHVTLALLHEFAGERRLRRTFSLRFSISNSGTSPLKIKSPRQTSSGSIMEDKRSHPRTRVFKAGTISFGGGAISCTVRNLTAAGALLEIEGPAGIPKKFTLVIVADEFRRACRVVWMSEKRLGVTFDAV